MERQQISQQPVYQKSIEALLQISLDRHKFHLERMPAFQYGVIKTYLWISTFLLTALMAVLRQYNGLLLVKIGMLASMVLSAIAFVIAVYIMKWPGSIKSCLEDLKALDKMAWNFACEDELGVSFMRSIIYGINDNINHLIATNNSRGLKLKAIAWLLIASAIIGFICVCIAVF